jgi:hypothetical protein
MLGMFAVDGQLLDSLAGISLWGYIDLDSIVLLNVTLRGKMLMLMRTTAAVLKERCRFI